MIMVHASLFSGIGGPEIAAQMLGWENAFHCEIQPFCREVLQYWFPNSVSYGNIYKTDFTPWRGKIDVLTGGFPCQPFSVAGTRRGTRDNRYLWPEMLRTISEIQPNWVVAENVVGILSMVESGTTIKMDYQTNLFNEDDNIYRYRHDQTYTIEQICKDLESLCYSVQPLIIPACAVGAPHRRYRVFIIAALDNPHDIRHKGTEIVGHETMSRNVGTTSNDGQTRFSSTDSHGTRSKSMRKRKNHLRKPHSVTDTDGLRSRPLCQQVQPEVSNGTQFKRFGNKWTIADTYNLWRGTLRHEMQTQGTQTSNVTTRFNCGISYRVGERWENFPTVSPIHRGNDGLSLPMDSLSIPWRRWRNQTLKAYGNAIVPQVMFEIFRAIELVTSQTQ